MYHTPHTVGAVVAGNALAFTGVNVVWAFLAGFALIGAGAALLRLVPRPEA